MKKIIALFAAFFVVFGMSMSIANATGGTKTCTPKAAYTETVHHPAETSVETVIDKAAYTETIPGTPAQHYSWTGGPIAEGSTPPAPPAGSWQANTAQEPHDNGNSPNVHWVDTAGSGLHYTGTPGNANWFYFAPGTEATTVSHPAETHEVPVVDKVASTDVITHEAVTCNGKKPVIRHDTTFEPAPVPTVRPKHVVTPTVVHAGL